MRNRTIQLVRLRVLSRFSIVNLFSRFHITQACITVQEYNEEIKARAFRLKAF